MYRRFFAALLSLCLVWVLLPVSAQGTTTGQAYMVTHTNNVNDNVRNYGPFEGGGTFSIDVAGTIGGYHFKEWEGTDELTLVEGSKYTSKISFIVPEQGAAIKSIWEANTTYPVAFSNNINDEGGSNNLPYGGVFHITQPATVGAYRFWGWEGADGLTFVKGDKSSALIEVVVPERAVSLKALYIRFDDVLPGAYYFDSVLWAVDRGITNGTSDTAFSPGNTCTTVNIITFLWRANNSPNPTGNNPFRDVDVNSYYGKAAVWASEQGMVSGDTFNGSSPCTRAAVMKYLWILAGKPSAGASSFTDVPDSADYAQAVSWAVQRGITNGKTETTFAPNDTCTRGQIATFLYRYYK